MGLHILEVRLNVTGPKPGKGGFMKRRGQDWENQWFLKAGVVVGRE